LRVGLGFCPYCHLAYSGGKRSGGQWGVRTQVNGVELLVTDLAGPPGGPSVVLLHHFGGSSRTWSEVIDRLRPEFRVVAPDLRGFGDSDPGEGQRVEEMAADVLELLGYLKLSRYILVGHSMGGKVAQAVAARGPAGLERLLLVAPSPLSPEPMAQSERARLLRGYGNRAEAERTNRNIVAEALPSLLFERVVEDNLRTSRAAWRSWLEAGSREDLSSLAAKIAVPTLVLAGEGDPVMPVPLLQREVLSRIAGARLETLAGTGHLLPLERPLEVASWIRTSGV